MEVVPLPAIRLIFEADNNKNIRVRGSILDFYSGALREEYFLVPVYPHTPYSWPFRFTPSLPA